MSQLLGLFGGENTVLTILIALAVVLLLIILAVWALKLVFNATGRAARGRAKRLGVVDVSPVDQKRQLVLVRRDNVEHLLLIGGNQDVVIESGITTEALNTRLARMSATAAPQPGAPQPLSPTQPAAMGQTPVSVAPTAPTPVPPVTPVAAPTSARFRTTNLPPDFTAQRPANTGNSLGSPARNSLRHTALLRPTERREPDFIPNSAPAPSPAFADSDTSSKVEPGPVENGAGSVEVENREEPQFERDGQDTQNNAPRRENEN